MTTRTLDYRIFNSIFLNYDENLNLRKHAYAHSREGQTNIREDTLRVALFPLPSRGHPSNFLVIFHNANWRSRDLASLIFVGYG